jgi:hypothetical protein
VEVVRRWWGAFADAFIAFVEEAAFRVVLAFDVLVGRAPRQVERRWWNRSAETPALVDLYDWTTDRLIFSLLVWPSLESSPVDADRVHQERLEQVLEVIAKGAADKMWSTFWEVDYGLRWDHKRGAWVTADGHAYAPPGEKVGGGW